MKKLILMTALVFSSSIAFAQFTGPSVAADNPVTVQEALQLKDDTKVALEGNIESHIGGKKYLFKDATGTIELKIKRDVWNGVEVSPQNTVVIYGEVDTHRRRNSDIDVDRIIVK